jgi:hypothetical protein
MGPAPKCHFVARLPSGNPEILKIGTLTTLEAHNFMCKTPIEVRSKVVAFVESFQIICASPPIHKEIKAIFDF